MKFPGFRARSLRVRLIAATIAIFVPMMLASGYAMSFLFEQHVERRVAAELNDHMSSLIHGADLRRDGTIRIDQSSLPTRFAMPLSGLYWQIEDAKGPIQTSASLSDFKLRLPVEETFELLEYVVSGPLGEKLILLTRPVSSGIATGRQNYRFAVGVSHGEVSRAVFEFARELSVVFTLLALTLLVILWFQISYGLRPLRRLGDAVLAISDGSADELKGNDIEETASLVAQLNSLLSQKEESIEKSRRRAVGLAHALKTPLTIIKTETQKLVGKDERVLADQIDEQVQIMSRRVDRELIRTKYRGRRHAATNSAVLPVVQGIVETLRRLPADKPIEWIVEMPKDLVVPMETDDLAEVLGNLMDNSRKWARAKVRIASDRRAGFIGLSVEDDGPGVPPSERSVLFEQPHRPDDATPGSGLGLAIVQDIVSEYGGSLHTHKPSLGGLGIGVRLPLEAESARPRAH